MATPVAVRFEGSPKKEQENRRLGPAPVRCGYVILAVALIAMWQQGSVWGIGFVAALVAAVTALESDRLTCFKAGRSGIEVEAGQRNRGVDDESPKGCDRAG